MKRVHFFIFLVVSVLISAGCSKPSQNIQVSVTFGKAWAYSPHSNEVLDWSGSLSVSGGSLDSVFKLSYGITNWEKGYGGCSREYSRKLESPEWNTDIRPGSGRGLEGIRFFIKGDSSSMITIDTKAGKASFRLGDLLEKEYLEFWFGSQYSFQPVSVYLGPDARPRLSKKAYNKLIKSENREAEMLVPDDFTGPKANFMSTWCAAVKPGQEISASFNSDRFKSALTKMIPVRLQVMAAKPDNPGNWETTTAWMEFDVGVGSYKSRVRHFFTWFRQAQKLFDIWIDFPVAAFAGTETAIRITNPDKENTLMLHRAFINEPRASQKEALASMPPLRTEPVFWVGYDLNTLTTQDGEVDSLLTRMHEEQIGNYVLFRIEENHTASPADIRRWGNLAMRYNFRAGTTMSDEVAGILAETMGNNFLGVHRHESSNLIYGWGDSEPLASRACRTLPECEEAYAARMKDIRMLGQALPMCNLDYKSGVNFISSEFPTGHSTLMMAANRGGAWLYNKPYWGVHLANHVMRMPDDETTLRRNFMFLWQAWLGGARLIYDEESALYGIHSTSYSPWDPFTLTRRRQMQELYHYGSAIQHGREVVKTGFLLGKYDCLVGGVQSSPEMEPTKVWGMFGPETDTWKFDTPERGWEMLDPWMPGVWLYPVKQDISKVRMFLAGSPHGQVDLITIDGDPEKLQKYDLLVLPGWNTMTQENYSKLINYVSNGGHLVLAATQCTNHITRDFLAEKRDFDFFNGGNLSDLCGIRVDSLSKPVNNVKWKDGRTCSAKGLPGLAVEMMPGTIALAESESGSPVLVEKAIGAGKVWTLVAGEYWGAASLDSFRGLLADTLTAMHRGEVYIDGDTRDVDFHLYELPEGLRRVVLMNTDWTSEGNIKTGILSAAGRQIPFSVKEGVLTSILIDADLAVSYTVPGAGARILQPVNGMETLSLSGTGKQQFILTSDRQIRLSEFNDPAVSISGNILTVNFGRHWEERIVRLRINQNNPSI